VTEAQLSEALSSQQGSGRRLGEELQRLALVPGEAVLRALAAQAGVSYLAHFDVSRLPEGPAWLPVDTVRALGVVPFELNDGQRRIKVICAAPVPRAALRALTKLTGWLPEAYLVADGVWEEAMRQYRSAGKDTAAAGAARVNDLAAAAAHVADVALADRAITMRHASYDRYTWVRVEGPRHWSDVWVTNGQEGPCLVEHTAH
jgi:hypothetical protein